MKKFEIIKPYKYDKDIKIIENSEDSDWESLRIYVDYDDVNHPKIKKKMLKLVRILNEHWDK